MRQLKFRVWDKLAKRFTYPDRGYQGHFILTLNGKFQNLQNGSGGDEYVVQQYTDVNDINGKEIYEGDYIEFKGTSKEYIGTVVWASGAFLIMAKTLYEEETLTYIWVKNITQKIFDYQIKVIGNIYDPPCNPDHNGECLVCDEWLTNCPFRVDKHEK